MNKAFIVTGNLVDVHQQRIYPAEIIVENERITAINNLEPQTPNFKHYILPGFVDAHVHIESSMLVPSEFARLAVVHGTVATVSDPHEIANVLGTPGIMYMIDDAARSPLKFHFGASSCVPACAFDRSGAVLGAAEVERLLDSPRIKYLSEMR